MTVNERTIVWLFDSADSTLFVTKLGSKLKHLLADLVESPELVSEENIILLIGSNQYKPLKELWIFLRMCEK